jgi:arylsulfatase A-like enzyme
MDHLGTSGGARHGTSEGRFRSEPGGKRTAVPRGGAPAEGVVPAAGAVLVSGRAAARVTRGIGLALPLLLAAGFGCGPSRARPVDSVILLVLDAASVRHFGSYGYSGGATPEIDRLAERGDLFLNAYSPAPYTRAALLSLLTSHEPGTPGTLEAPRLAELLATRGIHTAGFVGNPNAGPAYSFDRGFAEFHEAYTHGPQARAFRPLLRRFLRRNRSRRFFAWVHYREPHFPYDPPPAFAARFPLEALSRRAATDEAFLDAVCGRTGGPTAQNMRDLGHLYDANLAYVDAEVGWLWQQVVANGLADTTAVVLTADHGEALCEHAFVGHNIQVYDESVHVPLIVRRPGTYWPRRHPAMVSLVDLAPTIMGLFGFGEEGGSASFQGRDIFTERARDAPPRLLFARSATQPPSLALRDEDFSLVYRPSPEKLELFDRRRDLGELHDVSGAHPDLVSRYRAELLAREKRLSGVAAPSASRETPELRERLKALGYVE